MELKRLTNDADNLIRKVVSRYNQLYIPDGNISQVELDLLLDDLRKLYDTFKNIGRENLTHKNSFSQPEVKVYTDVPADSQTVVLTESVSSEKQAEKVSAAPAPTIPDPEPEIVNEKEPEITLTSKTEAVFLEETAVEPEIISEPQPEVVLTKETIVEAAPIPVFEAEPVQETRFTDTAEKPDMAKPFQDIPGGNTVYNPDPTPATLADRFITHNKSLSETLASTQPQAVMGSRIQFQPIADLITGIGLNDKFTFISDLFDNNTLQYEEAIARINRAVNFDEANWILQKYQTSEWEHKHETLARMKDFVKRRFI